MLSSDEYSLWVACLVLTGLILFSCQKSNELAVCQELWLNTYVIQRNTGSVWRSPRSGHRLLKKNFKEKFPGQHEQKKNYRESSSIKRARVTALTGSVPCKMAEGRQRNSALIRNRTHVARLSVTQLNH